MGANDVVNTDEFATFKQDVATTASIIDALTDGRPVRVALAALVMVTATTAAYGEVSRDVFMGLIGSAFDGAVRMKAEDDKQEGNK
jgi:hypothetical protein